MRTPWVLVAVIAAVATPAAAHEYADWFGYGRAELSPAGYRMVREVVDYANGRKPTLIVITGHMDTAEAEEFSDELSRRRAQAVATELVRLGIDPALIETVGVGAGQLARPTPPGTREPLNRRVLVGVGLGRR